MTEDEYLALTPGDAIRHRRTRRVRVVCSYGYTEGRNARARHAHRSTALALLKIGHSWTDPRPCAYYDPHVIIQEYDTTGRRGLSHRSAIEAGRGQPPPGFVWRRFRGREGRRAAA